MATVEELQKRGYNLTKDDITKLNKVMFTEYKKALTQMKNEYSIIFKSTLNNVNPEDYRSEMTKFGRMTKFKTKMKTIFNKMFKKVEKTLIEGSEIAFINNYYRQQYILNWMTKKPIFQSVNQSHVEASVFGSIDAVPFTPRYGKLVDDILEPNRKKVIKKLDSAITQGFIQGKGAQEVSKDIKKILNTSASNALRISRTEMMRNMNSGDYSNYLAAEDSGIDLQRQLISTLDTRTREQSGNMDGQIANKEGFLYPNGNRYLIPGNTGNPAWDINDRETVIDIVDGFKAESRSGRNPVTGKTEIMEFKQFNKWMDDNGLKRNKSGKIVQK